MPGTDAVGRAARPFRARLLFAVPVAVVVGVALAPGVSPAAAATGPLGYDPSDTGSLSSISRIVGAQDAWAKGWTGAGVDVALIDTGVAPVEGLATPGKVVVGPDLSLDGSGAAAPGVDAFGHGTFMAGLIAGRDSAARASAAGCTTCLNSSGYSDTTTFVGIAPDARIIDVKVGAADGAADVTQVIAAIDWVVQHAHDPGFNMRVISLSYGTDATQAYQADPLAQAAEQAWRHGIVVVAAAGNDGRSSSSLADPAYDPYLIAVGGDDPNGTLTTADDRVPTFAQHGTMARPVDVIAPATHVLGLRVPGSFVDTMAGNTGQVGTRFQRGSGTSEATAITAGIAALLVQRYPSATPNQVKALIDGSATPLPLSTTTASTSPTRTSTITAVNTYYSGHGIVHAGRAAALGLAAAVQTSPVSTGTGTLDGARGGVYLSDDGRELTGQRDVFGHVFDASAMAAAQTRAASWSGGIWNGNRWTGDGWSGGRWSPAVWSGADWTGSRWTGCRWTGMSWDGSRWTGSGWSGARWTGAAWDGAQWAGSTWG